MPASIVKKFADESGLSVETVEKLWKRAKLAAMRSYKEKDPNFWPVVVSLLKKMVKKAKTESLDYLLTTDIQKIRNEITTAAGMKANIPMGKGGLGYMDTLRYHCRNCGWTKISGVVIPKCDDCGSKQIEELHD